MAPRSRGTSSRMKSTSQPQDVAHMASSSAATPAGTTDLSLDQNYVPPNEGSVSPPPRSSSKRTNRSSSRSDRTPLPCAILGCLRKGTRLFTSLRGDYETKPRHSNRCCEGCYRRDLRRYKKTHPDPLKKSASSAQKQPQIQPQPVQKQKSHKNRSDLVPLGTARNRKHLDHLHQYYGQQKSPMQLLSNNGTPKFVDETKDVNHGGSGLTQRSSNVQQETSSFQLAPPSMPQNVQTPRLSSPHEPQQHPGSLVLPKMSFPHHGSERDSVQRHTAGSCQLDDVLFSKFCQIILRHEGMIQ